MLKSELFQQSYCIFVSDIVPGIKEKIESYSIQSIKILKAMFQEKLFCIVIPGHHAFKQYEKELFDIYKKSGNESGFWGQYSMGYPGKEWEVVS